MKANRCLIYHPVEVCARGLESLLKQAISRVTFQVVRENRTLFDRPSDLILIVEPTNANDRGLFSEKFRSKIIIISQNSKYEGKRFHQLHEDTTVEELVSLIKEKMLFPQSKQVAK